MSAPAIEGLRTERDGGILTITITRPHRMNAIDFATMDEIGNVLEATAADPSVRVVVLTGEGRAFCTGSDIAAGAAAGGVEVSPETIMDCANRVIRTIVSLPIPVIARVNGPAAGVGVSMALAADLTYASEDAYLLLAFINIGLMPDGGSSALIAAAAGRARATEMALLGDRLPAVDAAAAGLVTKVLPADQLDQHVDAVAAKLARGPRRALELTKKAMVAATLSGLDAALELEKAGQMELLTSADFIEGVTAKLTKREPNFGA